MTETENSAYSRENISKLSVRHIGKDFDWTKQLTSWQSLCLIPRIYFENFPPGYVNYNPTQITIDMIGFLSNTGNTFTLGSALDSNKKPKSKDPRNLIIDVAQYAHSVPSGNGYRISHPWENVQNIQPFFTFGIEKGRVIVIEHYKPEIPDSHYLYEGLYADGPGFYESELIRPTEVVSTSKVKYRKYNLVDGIYLRFKGQWSTPTVPVTFPQTAIVADRTDPRNRPYVWRFRRLDFDNNISPEEKLHWYWLRTEEFKKPSLLNESAFAEAGVSQDEHSRQVIASLKSDIAKLQSRLTNVEAERNKYKDALADATDRQSSDFMPNLLLQFGYSLDEFSTFPLSTQTTILQQLKRAIIVLNHPDTFRGYVHTQLEHERLLKEKVAQLEKFAKDKGITLR